jgi:hypothetical protein
MFSFDLTGLLSDNSYAVKMVAVNIKGESAFTPILYQYASAVPSDLLIPSLVPGTRTQTTL